MVSCAFSALCMYSKFGHHPHPLGYLCAKFRFFCDLHCWASPWRKIAYSITQTLTQLIWCPGNRSASTLENHRVAFYETPCTFKFWPNVAGRLCLSFGIKPITVELLKLSLPVISILSLHILSKSKKYRPNQLNIYLNFDINFTRTPHRAKYQIIKNLFPAFSSAFACIFWDFEVGDALSHKLDVGMAFAHTAL